MSMSRDSVNAFDAILAARHVARFDACWPSVRVDAVEVIPGPGGARARAIVQLGGLAPADVRVELVSLASGKATTTPPDDRRMHCNHPLGNGAFVFDATLPPHDVTRRTEWVIHVHPAEALDEPRVEQHFWSGSLDTPT
jgi:hypothetical protein